MGHVYSETPTFSYTLEKFQSYLQVCSFLFHVYYFSNVQGDVEHETHLYPLGKITSWGRPQKTSYGRPHMVLYVTS